VALGERVLAVGLRDALEKRKKALATVQRHAGSSAIARRPAGTMYPSGPISKYSGPQHGEMTALGFWVLTERTRVWERWALGATILVAVGPEKLHRSAADLIDEEILISTWSTPDGIAVVTLMEEPKGEFDVPMVAAAESHHVSYELHLYHVLAEDQSRWAYVDQFYNVDE
jgi:hypothetical protein